MRGSGSFFRSRFFFQDEDHLGRHNSGWAPIRRTKTTSDDKFWPSTPPERPQEYHFEVSQEAEPGKVFLLPYFFF